MRRRFLGAIAMAMVLAANLAAAQSTEPYEQPPINYSATEPRDAITGLQQRLTTGAVYWEGASELLEGGRRVGRGYLEMTGYVAPIRL